MTDAGTNGLAARGIAVAFGRNHVLRGVDLDVAPGETLVLFGPSGAGKTVLLRTIAGLEPGAAGRVTIGGRDVSATGPERRGLGFAFQNFALYPHLPASANIASPLQARGLAPAEIDRRVQDVARLLKIEHVLGNHPRALSNGQKQRTALARALVAEPGVLLLDDPLRNVDAKLRYEMRMELPRLLRQSGAASIYVSQDFREAMALADRVAVLVDGRIVQCDGPEAVYDSPATIAVARLFGDPPMNLVPCRVAHGGVEALGQRLPLQPSRHDAGPLRLGVRPDAIEVGLDPIGARATLVAATPVGERMVLLLRTEAGEELLASAAKAPPDGSAVFFKPDPALCLLYDEAAGTRVPASAMQVEHA